MTKHAVSTLMTGSGDLNEAAIATADKNNKPKMTHRIAIFMVTIMPLVN